MIKIDYKMVKYWLDLNTESEVIGSFKDLANGKYATELLKKDIIETWQDRNPQPIKINNITPKR